MHFPELFYCYFYIPIWTILEILNMQTYKQVYFAKTSTGHSGVLYDVSSRVCHSVTPCPKCYTKKHVVVIGLGDLYFYFYFWLYLNAAHSSWSRLPSQKSKQKKNIKFSSKLSKLYYIQVYFKLLKCNSEIQLSCFTNPYLLFSLEFLGVL